MKPAFRKLQQIEFEARIFISFGIVIVMCFLSFYVFRSARLNFVVIGDWLGMTSSEVQKWGYLLVALIMLCASLLRMWAGSMLTSQRMMAFRVQKDHLVYIGPYRIVRNPIYLADLIAYVGFALCLKHVGVALPLLIFIHYSQLVAYEERSLAEELGQPFIGYMRSTPRFFPNGRSVRRLLQERIEFSINIDGFRNNAVYLLFVPGFAISACTGSLLAGVMIGLPAVFDWAVVHTRKGIKPNPSQGELNVG